MEIDYYKVLDVKKGASNAEIQAAYGNIETKSSEQEEAYRILGNPHRRAAYDRWSHPQFGMAEWKTTGIHLVSSTTKIGPKPGTPELRVDSLQNISPDNLARSGTMEVWLDKHPAAVIAKMTPYYMVQLQYGYNRQPAGAWLLEFLERDSSIADRCLKEIPDDILAKSALVQKLLSLRADALITKMLPHYLRDLAVYDLRPDAEKVLLSFLASRPEIAHKIKRLTCESDLCMARKLEDRVNEITATTNPPETPNDAPEKPSPKGRVRAFVRRKIFGNH